MRAFTSLARRYLSHLDEGAATNQTSREVGVTGQAMLPLFMCSVYCIVSRLREGWRVQQTSCQENTSPLPMMEIGFSFAWAVAHLPRG